MRTVGYAIIRNVLDLFFGAVDVLGRLLFWPMIISLMVKNRGSKKYFMRLVVTWTAELAWLAALVFLLIKS